MWRLLHFLVSISVFFFEEACLDFVVMSADRKEGKRWKLAILVFGLTVKIRTLVI